eukprot:56869-Rhodomonas_salina.4
MGCGTKISVLRWVDSYQRIACFVLRWAERYQGTPSPVERRLMALVEENLSLLVASQARDSTAIACASMVL